MKLDHALLLDTILVPLGQADAADDGAGEPAEGSNGDADPSSHAERPGVKKIRKPLSKRVPRFLQTFSTL